MKRWGWAAMATIAVACGAGYLAHDRSHAPPRSKPSARPPAAAHRVRRALLVGCGQYKNPSIRPLEGPVNDVRLMKEVLARHCGFSPDEITTLAGDSHASDAPTRANIEREFRRLQTTARKDDQIVILLSGHGSQQPNQADDADDFELDGLDEIFLPIDAEQWASAGGADASGGVVNAIIDDEIYRWTAAIAEKGAIVWIIFDSCCAGTAVRGGCGEATRFVSAVDELMVPEGSTPKRKADYGAEASATDESRWQALPSERIVAFYACQAHESELELALPPATESGNVERAKHGLLTYALCSALSQAASETLTYRDLARDIWLRYRAWGRAAPTPFADGAIDRQVLGERQERNRFRVVRRSGRHGVMDGGSLEGFVPGSIVALYSSPAGGAGGEDRPKGYARVVDVQPAAARIVPCAYGEVRSAVGIEVGAWCELAYADFGDMRLAVAIDQESAMRAGQTSATLAQLSGQLQSLASAPNSVFKVVNDWSAADWVIQSRNSRLEFLPRSVAELAEGEPLPLGAPHFAIDNEHPAEATARLLQRVFRAQNLIKLASGFSSAAPPGRDSLKLKVELFSESAPLADSEVLVPGQEVEWKITNDGTAAIDLTLLFIDSELAIASAYPPSGRLADNRLAPGKSLLLEATVRANTLGAEYLVAIAARGRGPQRNFCCLAEPSLDAAQNVAAAVRGGGEDVLRSPLGRLLRYTLYNDELSAGATRGLASSSADDCSLSLRGWVVIPK